MDRQLLERMIGAGVLLVALILVVPAVLDGEGDQPARSDEGAHAPAATRTHTMRLDQPRERPPVATEVTKSVPVPPPRTQRLASADDAAVRSAPRVAPPPEKSEQARASTPPKRTEPEKAAVARAATAPAASAGPETAPATAGGWAVQLGSFAEQGNARRLIQEVGDKGFTAYVVPLRKSGRTLYRVRVGPKETRGQAEDLAGRLAAAGYAGQVTAQEAGS